MNRRQVIKLCRWIKELKGTSFVLKMYEHSEVSILKELMLKYGVILKIYIKSSPLYKCNGKGRF